MYLLMGGGLLLALVTSIYGLQNLGSKKGGPAATEPSSDDTSMVVIPAGRYTIGGGTTGFAAPEHAESLASFRIGKREVTVGEYNDFVVAGRAVAPWTGTMPLVPNLPVTRVGWSEANAYCAWRHPDGGRLPTEIEWEAAARGPSGFKYPWGNDPRPGAANAGSTGMGAPAPVGSFVLGNTPSGISDMIGNVWEWTASPLRAYPGVTPLADSLADYRVIRGGAFNAPDSIATTWRRGYNRPRAAPEALATTGFRCAK
jgi:formylglycine-generating enzyme required for sulfatase activity